MPRKVHVPILVELPPKLARAKAHMRQIKQAALDRKQETVTIGKPVKHKRRELPKREWPEPVEKLAPIPPRPAFEACSDKPVVSIDGKPTSLTLPTQEMTRKNYESEMRTTHLGLRAFLKNRNLDDLKLALSRNESPKTKKFLAALIDPKFASVDIATLAEKCGIGFGELMTVWRNDCLTEAMANLVSAAPAVAQNTAEDALSIRVCCTRCDGSGMMRINRSDEYSWVACISCSGTGAVRKVGDARSRQYVFEGTGIIKTGAGINVNISTGKSSSVESVLDEMERAAPRDFIDTFTE